MLGHGCGKLKRFVCNVQLIHRTFDFKRTQPFARWETPLDSVKLQSWSRVATSNQDRCPCNSSCATRIVMQSMQSQPCPRHAKQICQSVTTLYSQLASMEYKKYRSNIGLKWSTMRTMPIWFRLVSIWWVGVFVRGDDNQTSAEAKRTESHPHRKARKN